MAAFNPGQRSVGDGQSAGSCRRQPPSGETAKTWTVGVVLQPRFLPRLTITADWFNVKLKNAVRTALSTELVSLCVDQPSLDNVCAQT